MRAGDRGRGFARMLSGFKNFYSKSVDLIKQVQDQVAVKGQASAPVPTVAPEDTHPGFHLVDRWPHAPPCRTRCRRAMPLAFWLVTVVCAVGGCRAGTSAGGERCCRTRRTSRVRCR